jgi:serine/threonine-protein kinase
VVGADRFLTEIETTANLQHPHILPLFDSGEADGLLFYVMPYVEGETLRDRLERDKQLSIEEGVRIGTAVAGALDYAHRNGVVHRDIKPANILMHDGQPVVADFGIALAVGAGGGARLTETGLSVGTPYYMSPEQATGDQQVGPASDIYSLGCVVFEMLVGEPPYLGNTAQAVLGKIIQGEPVSATSARTSVSAHIDAAIRKALEKLPADRFTSAQEFGRALGDAGFRHGAGAAAPGTDAGRWKTMAMGLSAAVVILAVGLAWSVLGGEEPVPRVERFASPFLADQEPDNLGRQYSALAPDGSFLAYRSQSVLWVRRWEDLEATQVRGSNGGWTPSISPSGDAVSFWIAGEIKVVSLEGGPVQTLLTDVSGYQHWGGDGFMYVSTGGDGGSMIRVPAVGGAVDTLWSEPEGENHWVTDLLPGGEKVLLFTTFSDAERPPEIRLVDVEGGESKTVTTGVSPHYVPSGYLVYLAPDSSLMVAPMDEANGEFTAAPVALLEGVITFDVGDDGTLFYTAGNQVLQEFELVWMSMTGSVTPVHEGWVFNPDIDNRGWEISPDGTRIALKARTDLGNDIWVKELPAGPMTRLTFHDAAERRPTWHPDGAQMTFVSFRDGGEKAWMRRADGVGEAPARQASGTLWACAWEETRSRYHC